MKPNYIILILFTSFTVSCTKKTDKTLENLLLLQVVSSSNENYGDSLLCNGYAVNFPKKTNQRIFFTGNISYLTINATIDKKIVLTSSTTPLNNFLGVFLNPIYSNGLENCQTPRTENSSTIFTSTANTNRMEIQFTSAGYYAIKLGVIQSTPKDIMARIE
ncbi:hypothetical protein EHQ23_03615 [Leptospira bourretii]|uniref:Lipoprotein n=1 Tax=Leptospira bourretii TaxID=2484962 RepID=A0A4R9IQJ1_9LEPT|nr:hypothetical protein [Leptospira bourretii]TGK89483.1 hypothetical protein EHQ23_03615 [Leptospira bourretii]TGK93348.1 hypothetical protein EHQ26_04730 [Leptospira bourretii]TGL18280.1 hypothetical protein EHQ47_17230 [Leptospira bourretii]TGL30761.1 hypothetical protein EHQ45_12740 [Leptospira bourretii]